jgi:hypothetical protein
MLRSYVKLAWKVMWRRRFFTAISLFTEQPDEEHAGAS